MADPTLAELNERFAAGSSTGLEAAVVEELRSIMRLHQLSAQDVFYKWESFCLKMDAPEARPSVEMLRALKRDMQDALERTSRAAHAYAHSHTHAKPKPDRRGAAAVGATPRAAKSGGVFDMLDGLATPAAGARATRTGTTRRQLETPSVSRVKAEHPGSSPGGIEKQLNSLGALPPPSFASRLNPGKVEEVLNEDLPAAPESGSEPPPFSEPRIKLTAASDLKKLAYLPLFMKLSEVSEILDERIDEFTTWVAEHHELEDSAFGSAASQGTTEIVAVGRIASDASEGKLNTASLVLETSRRVGGGLRVPLNLEKLRGFQFFPGQIVALRGSNTTGREFVVAEVLAMPLLSNAASTPAALHAHRERLRGGVSSSGSNDPDAMEVDGADADPPPLTIFIASGPYTADDNLDFEPLHELCAQAADAHADALLLTGPFLDAEHPLVATGDIDLPPEVDSDTANMATAFRHLVSPALVDFAAACPHAALVLVPSVRDVVAKHIPWPQDALSRRDLGLPRTARLVGNPMTLNLNEAIIGLSSQDALWELHHEELTGGSAGLGRAPDPDLKARLPRYLIEQRHFFPLFPPVERSRLLPTGSGAPPPGAMLDVGYLKLGEMIRVRPDVLVVPSALPGFVKVVESVVVINPGYLAKRRGAGTYARMTLHAPRVSAEERSNTTAMLPHKVFERARVEIVRI